MVPAPVTKCGDGVRDKGEYCDCPEGVDMMCEGPEGVTCESLMMGSGMVYCKALECTYITTFCSAGAPPGGGAGTGGGAGAGG